MEVSRLRLARGAEQSLSTGKAGVQTSETTANWKYPCDGIGDLLDIGKHKSWKRLKVACVKASKPKERQLLQKKKSAGQGNSHGCNKLSRWSGPRIIFCQNLG
ncbi:5'-Nucleotidase Domain-Containing Protein 2 [Manis pentadactyla]|nr:5'-Nucleotidase Domain-Containing Protein 2 [Manis pentadactyla]